MLNRYLSLALLVCIAASTAALGQNPGAEYLFQLPNVATSPQFVPYNALANPMSALAATSGPNGINAIVAMPTGSKFYLIGSTSIQSVDPTFQNFHGINLTEPSGLSPTITAATLTPNGAYLLVGTLDSSNNSYLFIVNTSTDQQVTGSSLPVQLGGVAGPYNNTQSAPCPSCWIAVSRDSTEAYVLENSVFGGPTQVVAYNLSTFQKIGSAIPSQGIATGFQGAGNALSLSPQNVLYMTGGNLIVEIDPVSLNQIGNTIQLGDFNCSQLQFTPDGTTAYAINQVPRQPGAGSLLAFTVSSGAVSYWPALNATAGPQLSSVFVAGNNTCPSGRCIFAYSSPSVLGQTTGIFYDVTPVTGGLSASVSQPSPTLSNAVPLPGQPCPGAVSVAECVLAATVSNELPASNYLYVLIANGNQPYLDRISISTDTVSVTNGSPAPFPTGSMQFVSIPVQGAAASFLQFNNNQTVNPGGTSIPMIARALGSTGLPVYDTAGTFSADPTSGLIINTPNITTGADGYAQTTVTVPAGGATCSNSVCTITLTLGGTSTTFTLNVPGSGPSGGGTGPGSTSSQISIISGQGQLVAAGSGTAPFPLTVLVTDPNGVPLSNVTVSFSVTQGNGGISETSVQTDMNGLASVNWVAESISNSVPFETDIIVASATVGSATFYETAFASPGGNVNGIQTELLAPLAGEAIQVSPGAPATNAIQAFISTIPFGGFVSAPIPYVGITLLDPNNPQNVSPVVSCQNSPVSDQTGNVSCTVVTSCSVAPGAYGIIISTGGVSQTNATVQVGQGGGGAAKIAATSGNNQSGSAGQRAALPLIATLTNFCGNPVVGTSVTWAVTKGSATLQNTTTTSGVGGIVSNVLTFGQTPGSITVTATISGGATATFTLTNSVVISGVTAVSGSGQTATVNQGFANPLVVSVVDSNKNPVSGLAVNFTVTSGSATVNPTATDTGTNGQAQTSVTAGAVAGPVTITASISGSLFTTFNLTVTPAGPTVTATSFVNAASSVVGLVPCGLGTVTGAGLAAGVQGVVSGLSAFGPLPYTLANLSMTINGVPAPIEAVANQNGTQQVNFQTPCETAGSTSATVVITISGASTTVTGVPVLTAQPGIFTYAGPNNLPYGAVISAANGSYVTPSNLAQRGQTYYVIVTGMGQTSPPLTTNSAGIAGENVIPTVIVGVNNNGVPVISATALPDQIGVYLIGFQIPVSTPPSSAAVPLSVAVVLSNGTVVYSNPVYLAGIM
jgi:hypothetical protein